MTRKIARQSETTPLNTIDNYLWNERLGVTQLPEAGTPQPQDPNTSSLPPQSSQAPALEYDSSQSQSDMFGTGVSGADQLIAPPKAPNTMPASNPARSKAAANQVNNINTPSRLIQHFGLGHRHSAVSTLYGDVNPTPTTGESSGGNGSQSNRNNSSEEEPGGPTSSPVNNLAEGEEGGAGLAADLGEAASLALAASNHWVSGVLEPPSRVKTAKFKYIRHNSKTGKWEIFSKKTGKTLSTHDSEKKAQEAFRAMESNMHS